MRNKLVVVAFAVAAVGGFAVYPIVQSAHLGSCLAYFAGGFRPIAKERSERFLGKVEQDTARCRGGDAAAGWTTTPWIDWQRYWAAGDSQSRYSGLLARLGFLNPNRRGVQGALLDLEYQRMELLRFNLFDNSGTFEGYVRQGNGEGELERVWPQFRLPPSHPFYAAVGGNGPQQCTGDLIRFRTGDGICNDLRNPLMGATGRSFARNVEFTETFPDLGQHEITKNRHGERIGLLKPDPQIISRKLFSRQQTQPERCNAGRGLSRHSAAAHCDYKKAPHLNVLAAFWIQFVIHDWFSHLDEGANGPQWMAMGCASSALRALSGDDIEKLGCRAGDRMDRAIFAEDSPPETFRWRNKEFLSRAYKTTPNNVTAWWDASQIYGYDPRSMRRVKRDPHDRAKLRLEAVPERSREVGGYLPLLEPSDPAHPQWRGQEAVAFPDNWNVGLSLFHHVFAREHNAFVAAFRALAERAPQEDSGLRHPAHPDRPIAYGDVTADELFEIARLVVSAQIAKIHTIEWTPQLLYNEPLYLATNANWSGLLESYPLASAALEKVTRRLAASNNQEKSAQWFSAFAAGPGIVGLGNRSPDSNAGIHHFGSPFNFPEEFINAYRLHPMVPDLLEYRDLGSDPNKIQLKIPVNETLRDRAAVEMRSRGLANWALSMGRQRVGQITLKNHPLFLQKLEMPRLKSVTGKIDVAALDILRDRERGIPRYNEFRRQYGLKQLTSFEDFIDPRAPKNSAEQQEQEKIVRLLREVYGQHRCDAAKIITAAQKNDDGSPITDCLGKPDGSLVDNIEDLDAMVGWLAEFVRPHGAAISETQLQVFILNASRRLFSDRFFTSSFRPEFYSHFGIDWVNHNGPDGKITEKHQSNGRTIEVSPLKRVLLRVAPELAAELESVVNVFDPWARDRGEYYSLQWKPRAGAESDPSFARPE